MITIGRIVTDGSTRRNLRSPVSMVHARDRARTAARIWLAVAQTK
jgi:hypothetical protein